MQLPTIDRIPSQRPVASEAAALSVGRVIPVPPVNGTPQTVSETGFVPSVVDMINPAYKNNDGGNVYVGVADPTRPDAQAKDLNEQWKIDRPAAQEVKEPPKPPLQELILNYLKSLWEASASAVQVQQQTKDQLDIKPTDGIDKGTLATQVLTYSPTKINKTEKPLT